MPKSNKKAVNTAKKVAVKTAKKVAPLYKASELTKNSSKNLWVAFKAGKISNGLVFNSTLTRDQVRNNGRIALGSKNISEIRSVRVNTYKRRMKTA